MSVTLAVLASIMVFQTPVDRDSKVEAASLPSSVNGSDATDRQGDNSQKVKDASHPDFVRCKSESVIGSRAKRKRTCMTNRQWALVERRGNEASKTFAGDNFANGYN